MSTIAPGTKQQRAQRSQLEWHERECATFLHYFTYVEHMGGRATTIDSEKIPGWIIQTASCPPPATGLIPLYAMFPHPPPSSTIGKDEEEEEEKEGESNPGGTGGFLLCRTVYSQARAFGHMLGANTDTEPTARRLLGHVPLYAVTDQDKGTTALFVWTQQDPPSPLPKGTPYCICIGERMGDGTGDDTIVLPADTPMPAFLVAIARALRLPGEGFATVDTRHPNTDELGHLVAHLPGALAK